MTQSPLPLRRRVRAVEALQDAIIEANARPARDPEAGRVTLRLPILEAEQLLAAAQYGLVERRV